MADKPTAIVTGPGEGERLSPGSRSRLIRVDLPQLSVVEIVFEPGFRVELHTHDDHVDSFYVLEGEVEFLLEDGSQIKGPDTFVAVPIGVPHGFANPGPGEARMLNIHTPDAGWNDWLRS